MVKQKQELASEQKESTRTTLTEACRIILQSLKQTGKPVTISELVRMTELNRKTVDKCTEFLQLIQKELERNKIILNQMNHLKLIELEPRVGMLSLPEKTQRLIIRALYYPEPSEEVYLLVHLYLRKAVDPEHAILVPKTKPARKLSKQGQILESGKGIYLSSEGMKVAKGALRIYSELRNAAQ
jgi:hypothetical protein